MRTRLSVVAALVSASLVVATVPAGAAVDPRQIGTIALPGCTADRGVFSADGSRLYVAGAFSRFVCVVNTRSGRVIRRIALGPSNKTAGSSLALSTDGRTLFAARAVTKANGLLEGQLVSIDVTTGTVSPIARPVFGLTDGRVFGPVDVFDIVLSRDGSQVLAIGATNAVMFYDLPSSSWLPVLVGTGRNPTSILMSPDGATAYVLGSNEATITTVNVADQTSQISPRSYGAFMPPMAISPDGTRLYALNPDRATVLTIDAGTLEILHRTRLRPEVVSVAVNPATGQVWVTEDRNTLAWTAAHPFTVRPPRIAILAADGTTTGTFAVGGQVARQGPILFSPDGRVAYVRESVGLRSDRLVVVAVPARG